MQREANRRLISTIDNTGGIIRHRNGTHGPAIDPDWIDLGEAYLAACREENRRPKVARNDYEAGKI